MPANGARPAFGKGECYAERMPRATMILALHVALLAACGDVKPGAARKVCTKAYEQCTMPSGVLGVCNTVDCPPGEPEPCFVCRSQH